MEQATKLEFDDHVKNLSNPNSVTKDQIGLGNVNIEQASKTNFNNHATDKTIHVTVNDRNKWNTAEANSKACTDVHAADTVNYQKLPQIMAVCQLPLMKERTYFKK
ncbi:hypothetical protein ACKOKD_05945 [Bacillus mojavensis]|uniref:hypothetical protein n=1 Tax=Bacillus mojavensis TaxID=72360 RepID=UPI003966C7FC